MSASSQPSATPRRCRRRIGSSSCHSSAASACAVALRIALVVPAEPVRQALEEHRPSPARAVGEEPGERLAHRDDVVAVDGLPLHVVRRDDVADALDVRVRRARRELREAVVLADEDHRQPPTASARLTDSTKMPPWTAPSPKKTTATWSPPRRRAASALPSASGMFPPDDTRRAHEAVLDVDEVHRAAQTAAEAAVPAHQLGHDATERCALRDRVAVRTVAAVHGVVGSQLPAHADRHSLLADAQVHETVHLVGAGQLADALLEDADPPHRAQELEADVAAEPAGRALGHG